MKLKRYLKNIKQRQSYKQTEMFQKVLKSLFFYLKNKKLQLVVQKILVFKLYNSFFKTAIHNFCVVTGRARGLVTKFKVSRILFKSLAETGLFFGLQKLS
jgi:ribosomal protein S14